MATTTYSLKYDIEDAKKNLKLLQEYNTNTYRQATNSIKELNQVQTRHEKTVQASINTQKKLSENINRLNKIKAQNAGLTDRQVEALKKLKDLRRAELARESAIKSALRSTTAATRNKISAQQAEIASTRKQIQLGKAEIAGRRKEETALKSVANQQKKNNAIRSTTRNSIVRHLRQLETLAVAIYSVSRAYQATIGRGIELNKTIENNSFGLAALISSNVDLVRNNEIVEDSQAKFDLAFLKSADTMLKLKDASALTVASFPQLTEIFQQAIGFSLKMGDAFAKGTDQAIDRTIELSQAMSNMGGAVGMTSDLVLEEIRSLFTGDITRDSKLGILLFGSPTAANAAIKAAGDNVDGVYNLLKTKLIEFERLGGIDTFMFAQLKMVAEWDKAMADMTKPIFGDFKEDMKDATKWIKANQKAIIEWGQTGYRAIRDIISSLDDLAIAFIAYKTINWTKSIIEATVAAGGLTKALKATTAAQWLLNSSIKANPYVIGATGIIAAVTALGLYAKRANEARENIDLATDAGIRKEIEHQKTLLNTIEMTDKAAEATKRYIDQLELRLTATPLKRAEVKQEKLIMRLTPEVSGKARENIEKEIFETQLLIDSLIAESRQKRLEASDDELRAKDQSLKKLLALQKEYAKEVDKIMEEAFKKAFAADRTDSSFYALRQMAEAMKDASEGGLEISEEDKQFIEGMGVSFGEEFVDAGDIVAKTIASTMSDVILEAMREGSIDLQKAISAGATGIGTGLISAGTGLAAQQMMGPAGLGLGPGGAIAAGIGLAAIGGALGEKKPTISLDERADRRFQDLISAIKDNTEILSLTRAGTAEAQEKEAIVTEITKRQEALSILGLGEDATIKEISIAILEATEAKKGTGAIQELKDLGFKTGRISKLIADIGTLDALQEELTTREIQDQIKLGQYGKISSEQADKFIAAEAKRLDIIVDSTNFMDKLAEASERANDDILFGTETLTAFDKKILEIADNSQGVVSVLGETSNGMDKASESITRYNSSISDQISLYSGAASSFGGVESQAQSAIDAIQGVLKAPADNVDYLLGRYTKEKQDVETALEQFKSDETAENLAAYNKEVGEFFGIADQYKEAIVSTFASSEPGKLQAIVEDMKGIRDVAKTDSEYYQEMVDDNKDIKRLLTELKTSIDDGNVLTADQTIELEKVTAATEETARKPGAIIDELATVG